MSQEGIFDEIEGEQFGAEMRVIAGFTLLLDALEDDDLVQRLITRMRESTSDQERAISRIATLLDKNDEPDYLHPFDSAIAAYLYALNAVDPKQAQQISQSVLETPQLWWARRLAKQITEAVVPTVK